MDDYTPPEEQRVEAYERLTGVVEKLVALFGANVATAMVGSALALVMAKASARQELLDDPKIVPFDRTKH